jgi:hypothetical protein
LPRGHDEWESHCPGHGGVDHALHLSRAKDGKLIMLCRSRECCSFSSVLKKLNIKLRHLDRETHPSVIGRLRAAEIQLGLYPSPELRLPDPSMVNLPGENYQRDGPASNEEDGVAADVPAILAP